MEILKFEKLKIKIKILRRNKEMYGYTKVF